MVVAGHFVGRIKYSILVFLSIVGLPAVAQTVSHDSLAVCATRLSIPQYPILALSARIQGTVSGLVTIAPDGTVKSIEVTASQALLESTVRDELARSRFSPACAAGKLELVFEFVIEGDPVEHPISRTLFTGPNKFTISAQPLLTMP